MLIAHPGFVAGNRDFRRGDPDAEACGGFAQFSQDLRLHLGRHFDKDPQRDGLMDESLPDVEHAHIVARQDLSDRMGQPGLILSADLYQYYHPDPILRCENMEKMILAILLALAPAQSPQDAAALIQAAIAARKAQEAKGWKYTFRMDEEHFAVANDGHESIRIRKTYDIIMLEGDTYKKLVSVDGNPPDAKLQRKIDGDLKRERENRKRKHHLGTIERSMVIAEIESLERLFVNRTDGEETLGGRPAWRVASEPKPGLKPASKDDEQPLSTRRVSWFDTQDGIEVRRRVEYFREAGGFRPGTVLETRYAKVGDAWLVAEEDMHLDMKIAGGIHARGRSHFLFRDTNGSRRRAN